MGLPRPWWQPPPPAPAWNYQTAPLHPGPRWSQWLGHFHFRTRLPDPGADAWAYEALGLYEQTPIGAGDHNREQLRVLAGATLFAGRAISAQGVGGLSAGQWINAPLIVPQELLSEPIGGYDDENPFGG